MSEKTAGLARARAERSQQKRRAVENALAELKDRNETVTFKAVATLAEVSRPYLYNNFREAIKAAREASRASSATVDGVTVPNRTPDESKHVEALLRNKIDKLQKELANIRQENTRLKMALENERGRSEHYRNTRFNTKLE